MFERTDVEFCARDGIVLRARLFVPTHVNGPAPAISMAHGFAGTRMHGIEHFAKLFAEQGFVVLLHVHRGFGASEGSLREVQPVAQQLPSFTRYPDAFNLSHFIP